MKEGRKGGKEERRTEGSIGNKEGNKETRKRGR